MAQFDKVFLQQLLMLDEPWEVSEYRLDVHKRRCDVAIAQATERGWFGRPRRPPAAGYEGSWQHLSYGPIRFQLTAAIPLGYDTEGLPWVGEAGLPFTRALSARVFALFNEGVELQSVCKLLDLSLQDVWRYRYALDTGRAGARSRERPRPREAESVPGERPNVPVAAAASTAASEVPDVTDPLWLRLIDGDLPLDIRMLSLKLMLTRLRSQLELISDDEVRMLKLRELHRYFVKNERMLTHELAQLRSVVMR